MKKILLKREKCIGCAICVDIIPDLFAIHDADGRAFILNEPLSTIQQSTYPFMNDKALIEMAQNCPVSAIEIK